MAFDILSVIPGTLTTLVLGFVGYTYKRNADKVDVLEHKVNERLTEESVRLIINDKIDPVREDLQEIKVKIDKLSDKIIEVQIQRLD